MTCPWCEGPIPPSRGGRPRKFCCDNCRKRAHERASRHPCVDCGAPVWRGERCVPCHRVFAHRRHEELLTFIADQYNAGVPLREIAAMLGRKPIRSGACGIGREMNDLRKAGRIGYRYAGCEKRAA